MVSLYPPTVPTLTQLNPNMDASVYQGSELLRNTVAALQAAENAVLNGVGSKRTYKYTYRFATLGGAVGTIALTAPDGAMPANFIIQNAFIRVHTALVHTAAATAALTTGQAAGDLIAATVVAGAPWSSTGLKLCIPDLATVADQIITTAARSPSLVVAVDALTAGSFDLFIEGFLSTP